ncbi:MAG TPA: WD40 repeat domain-containing protein [Gemmataceae bacterium]|nr:WD40 repeat domain-containing protein [Gemmataceae bacterium]
MMPNLQDRLALSPDGTLAAYVRSTARESPPARFDELVLIATVNGKVLRRVALSADRSDRSFEGQGLVTPRFRADGSTVLIARIDRYGQMPTAEIEQRTIETGERVKTVPLEPPPPPPGTRVPADVPPIYFLPSLQRLTFSPDGRLLLGIEIPYSGVRAGDSGRPFRTLVWNVADGTLLGHHAVFQTQGFGASGELIGYNGRDLEFRDPVTGKPVRTLAPPPDLKTVPELQAQAGRILGFSPTRLRPSIWASPDARWLLMLVAKGNYGGLYDADMLVALDARTGREAGRLEFPLTRGMGLIPFGRLLSLAACDREGRWVALLTPSDVRILTMPGLDVLSTQPFDLEAEQQARQSGRPIPVFRLPIGLVADDAGASLYGVTYPLNAAQPYAAPDPGTTPPRLDETVFGFDLALPAGSPLRALAGGAVTGVAFDPRARFLFAAGEERLVRALDSGTAAPAWASGFAGQGDLNYQARLDPTGQVLIVVLPGQVALWDVATGRLRRTERGGLPSPDGRFLAVPEADQAPARRRRWRVLDVAADRWRFTTEEDVATGLPLGGTGRIEFTADSRYLLISGWHARGPNPLPAGPSNPQPVACAVIDLHEARLVGTLPVPDWISQSQALDQDRFRAATPASSLNRPTVLALDRDEGNKTLLRAFELATTKPLGALPLDTRKSSLFDFNRIGISPDGRTVLLHGIPLDERPRAGGPGTRSESNVLLLWRVGSPRVEPLPTAVEDLSMPDFKVAFNGRGDRLVIEGDRDQNREVVIELWDMQDLKTLRTAVVARRGQGDQAVHGVSRSFSSVEHRFLVDAATDRLAVPLLTPVEGQPDPTRTEVWDVRTGAVLASHPGTPIGRTGPWSDAGGLQSSAAGPRLVLGRGGRPAALIDFVSGEEMADLRDPKTTGNFRLTPDGKTGLVQLQSDPSSPTWDLQIRDPESGVTRATLPGQTLLEHGVSPDSRWAVTSDGGTASALRLWDLGAARPGWTFPLDPSGEPLLAAPGPLQVGFSADSRRLLVRSRERYRVFDVETGQVLLTPDKPSHHQAITGLAIRPDSGLVATAGLDGTVGLWRAEDGRFAGLIEGPAAFRAVAFHPDGRTLTAGDDAGRVRTWTLPEQPDGAGLWQAAPTWSTPSDTAHRGPARALVFSPRGDLLASASDDGAIALWDPAEGRRLRVIDTRAGAVRALAFRPDGTALASAGSDGTVRLWDTRTGAALRSWPAGLGDLNSLAFSPDGSTCATAGNGVRLWRAGDGRPILLVDQGSEEVLALGFSPDGHRLALGRRDRLTLVVDLQALRTRLREYALDW